MSAARDLPARPSLDSLRKQAKKLARDAAAGNTRSRRSRSRAIAAGDTSLSRIAMRSSSSRANTDSPAGRI